MKILEYDGPGGYLEAVMASSIIRFSKKEGTGGDVTLIHLHGGEVVETTSSIKTLVARLRSEDE
jgi:hypothetical protein